MVMVHLLHPFINIIHIDSCFALAHPNQICSMEEVGEMVALMVEYHGNTSKIGMRSAVCALDWFPAPNFVL